MGGVGPIQPACMFAEGAGGGLEGLVGWAQFNLSVCLLREQGVVRKYGWGGPNSTCLYVC